MENTLKKPKSNSFENIPLKYNLINSNIKNILLIDGDVYQNETLYSSVNSNTLAIKYNISSSKKELEDLMTNNFTEITRIGFAFNDASINSKRFLDMELFFTRNDLNLTKSKPIESNKEQIQKYSSNLQFIIDLIKKFNIKNIDYLVCNGLKYDNWVKYFNIITKETGVIVGASDNLTGNLKYGGDWVLESTNEDIKNIYWDESIINYSSNLIASPNVTESIIPSSGYIPIKLDLIDNAGDGWEGNRFQLIDNTSTVVWEVTLNSGSKGTASTYVLPGDYTINMVVGSFSGEVRWTLTVDTDTYSGGSPYSGAITIDPVNKILIPSQILSDTNTNVNYINDTFLSGNEYKMINEATGAIISSGTSFNGYVIFTVNLSYGIYKVLILDDSDNLIQSGLNLTVKTNIINTSKTITNADISLYDWPVTINGGSSDSPVVVTFGDDITLNSSSQYFIIGSEYITIDGNNYNVTIDGVSDWKGLFYNDEFSNIKINNINMSAISSILEGNSGWLCQQNFSSNYTYINNCSTNSTCNSQKSINTGLICGPNTYGVICNNCSSAGTISAGGIFGADCSNCQANNCFSTGQIGGYNGWGAGGIFAHNCYSVKATNCYSMGDIYDSYGYGSGGICGEGCEIIVTNCYSRGVIGINGGTNCGGIFGTNSYGTATNCYSSGKILNGYGIGEEEEYILVKCYIANDAWSDADANLNLTETPTYNSSGSLVNPVGTVWADIAPDSTSVPWIFSTFGYSPYTTELVTTFSQTIKQGGKTIEALETTGHTYSIIAINDKLPSLFPGITINSSTGQISVSSSTPPNKYLIKVLKNSDYVLTDFELTLKLKSNNFCLKIRLCRNEKYVIMLNKTNSKYALMEKYIIIKKPTHGKVCINSKSKLEYTPDKNYVGSDEFVIEYKNIIPELSIQVTFKIKITK